MKKYFIYGLMVVASAFPLSVGAVATYVMKVTPSMPKGSAGEKLLTTQPANTKLSPCNSALVDAVTFSLAYNAGSASDKLDVYVFFFNPNGDGIFSPRFYIVSKSALTTGGFALVPRSALTDLDAMSDIYLPKEANPGVAITETLFGSFVSIDGVPAGTWQLVGIVADRTTVNFDDPSTWAAWDVATVILRKPWIGSNNSVCE